MLLLLFAIGLSLYCDSAYGRNETIHACELVVKCFQEADLELMQCQDILAEDSSVASGAGVDGDAGNNTTSEAVSAAPTDECMAGIKQKMIQKRTLVEQRAQAFALCLNERMDRGPEDVEPRKFRYCNTVISRYNARTAAPPDFTLPTTPTSIELVSPNEQASGNAVITTNGSTSGASTPQLALSSNATVIATSRAPASSSQASASSPLPPILNVRPRRQAPSVQVKPNTASAFAAFANAAGNSTSSSVSPPSAGPPGGNRVEQLGSTESSGSTSSASENPTDAPVEQAVFNIPQNTSGLDNGAGRIGAVARFSSKGQPLTANKEQGQEQAIEQASLPLKNGSSISAQSSSFAASGESTDLPSSTSSIQNSLPVDSAEVDLSKPEASVFPTSLNASSSGSPPSTGSPGPALPSLKASLDGANESASSSPLDFNSALQPQLQIGNASVSIPENDTFGASPVLVQQSEQLDLSVVKPSPLEQPSIDSQPQEASGGKVETEPLAGGQSLEVTSASPAGSAGAVVPSGSTVEEQRNRVETLRESRRRVSEFKACMARARIKREECKPLVNCCPDSIKCHLRYELSELHDQIHRLELDISEGRQACLEKKKPENKGSDALDQIDEEDLVSDESVVSQQVF